MQLLYGVTILMMKSRITMKAYILKLTFEDIEPVVWRRVVLPAGATFNRLHELIQRVTNF